MSTLLLDPIPEVRVRPPLDLAQVAERAADREYRTMLNAYQHRGGLMSSDTVAECLRRTHPQPLSRLARWIVARSVVIVQWHGRTLVPLFQFTPCDWSVRADVARVLDELRDTFDDWELALWFVTPNIWLESRLPLECVGADDLELLHAARADRYIAHG